MVKKFIQGMHMKKGALHKELGVPQGEKIPKAKLAKAAKTAKKTHNAKLAKRLVLAKTLSGFRKTGSRKQS